MKTFIHVGLQKTGTTALQELVFKQMDVNYIRYLDRELYKTTLISLKPTLISNEDLCGVPYDTRFMNRYQIAENLHVLFPDAHIILGIRDEKSWMKSMYKESIRQGCTMNYEQYQRRFPRWMLCFEDYITVLKNLFPRIYVFRYEDMMKNFDSIVTDICDFVGVTIPAYEQKILNKSLQDWQIPGFRLANKIFPKKFFRFYYNMIREDGFQ